MVNNKQKGSTLIEVLVASLIFALGTLGIANSLGRGVHASIDNNARAQASSVASQIAEPLYIAAAKVSNGTLTETEFKALLAGMSDTTVHGNDGKDDFLVNVLEAKDSNDLDVLANAPPYSSPVRVVLEIGYQGLNDTKTTRSNYTIVW